VSGCCPEFDHQRATLERILREPIDRVRAREILAFLREAHVRVSDAGCSCFDERSLLMPAVLRLLLSDEIDGPTRLNLRTWVEVMDASTEPRVSLRRAG
jgi:hypothetical protein